MSEKTCTGCGESKPLDAFYKRSRSKDGHNPRCRACCAVANAKWRAEHSEEKRRSDREYAAAHKEQAAVRGRRWKEQNPEKVAESRRLYKRRNRAAIRAKERERCRANPGPHREHIKRYVNENPEKLAAHREVAKAIRRGELIRPTVCEKCGETAPKIHAHHDDYSKPLEVRWLCPICHRAEHPRQGADRRLT